MALTGCVGLCRRAHRLNDLQAGTQPDGSSARVALFSLTLHIFQWSE